MALYYIAWVPVDAGPPRDPEAVADKIRIGIRNHFVEETSPHPDRESPYGGDIDFVHTMTSPHPAAMAAARSVMSAVAPGCDVEIYRSRFGVGAEGLDADASNACVRQTLGASGQPFFVAPASVEESKKGVAALFEELACGPGSEGPLPAIANKLIINLFFAPRDFVHAIVCATDPFFDHEDSFPSEIEGNETCMYLIRHETSPETGESSGSVVTCA